MVKIKYYEPMSLHTSFKCGGCAKFFYEIESIEDFVEVVKKCKNLKQKIFILGNGTNTLCVDSGFNGVVISTKNYNKINLEKSGNITNIELESGASLYKLNKLLADIGIEGLEWSYGIPGTIGGAVVMNAGAYGQEIFNFVDYVVVYNRGKTKKIYKKNIKYTYRNGGLKGKIILRVGLKIISKNSCCVRENQLYFMKKRLLSQPLDLPNAGSIFKRSGEIIPAQIIDNLGLKGVIIGGAKVSEKHAGFIVNFNNATASDIIELIQYIQKVVYDKLDIKLEEEIVLLK